MGGHSSKQKNSYKVAPVASQSQTTRSAAPVTVAASESVPTTTVVPKVDDTSKAETAASPPPPVPVDSRLVPNWINEAQFVEILRESVPKFAKIRSFNVKPGLGAGENYATLMLRVSIEAELADNTVKPVSYMMKVPHDTPMMQEMMQMANFFTLENEAYLDLLPKLAELYKAKGVNVNLAPRAYKFTEAAKQEPKLTNTVLMYDLGQDGFKNLNRFEGLDLEQTKLVLRKMAQYHAAGAQLKSVNGLTETMTNGAFGHLGDKAVDLMAAILVPSQKMFLEHLKNYDGVVKYQDKLETYFGKIFELFKMMGPYDPNDFNVVLHGDCWVNNFLFKTGPNDELIDMVFVDFQNPRFGHPLCDLLYFIMTSVKLEHKLSDFDFFIKYYYDHLIEHLQILEYKERIPKLSEFYIQLYKYGSWAIMGTYMVLPVVLLDPTATATFENFWNADTEGTEFRNLMYTNKRYKKHIEQILPWLDNRGMLDAYEIPEAPVKQVQIEVDAAAPEWVTVDYFRDLLKAEKSDIKEITGFRAKKATSAGDNYLSIILAVDIDYETTSGANSSTSLMLKVPTGSEMGNVILELMSTFKKEIIMYNEVIPQLEELYRQIGQPIVFGPKNYKFQKETDTNRILLENLRTAGYKNADRLQGLSIAETEQVLAKLAKFHAASAQLYVTKGPFVDCLDKPLHTEQTRAVYENPEHLAFMDICIESLQGLKGSELYGDKVTAIIKNLFNLQAKAELYDKTEFNCLNHGDCWTNNLMFSYGPQGEIKDTLFIDFQLSSFNTPALDLYYFLMSSPSFDIKLEKFDYFVRFYHGELQRNLELLKYPREIPSLRELHTILLKHSIWAVTTTSSVMSAVLLDPTANASIENMMADNEEGRNFKKRLFQNERYRKHAEAIYTFLNHRGLLDFE